MFKIKEARKNVGLTQQQLADKVNVTRFYMSAIENNHKTPSFYLLERIARELHTSIKNLIEETA